MPGLVPGIHVFYRPCDQDVDGRDKPGHDGKMAMHDIKWIRENPDAFDAALKRRGLPPFSATLVELDIKRRTAILTFETGAGAAQYGVKGDRDRKNAKDEARATMLMAEVAEFKTTHSAT